MSFEATGLQMRRLKMEALEKGEMTDYSFIVGPEKTTAEVKFRISFGVVCALNINFVFSRQLVHCLKFDLMMASGYFEGLIRSGEPCPVHVKHIQPRIFKMLIR